MAKRRHPRLEFDEPERPTADEVAALLRPLARPLSSRGDLDPLLDRVGDARFVLLGEATHGTHEFYEWRARLTERLIEERGFSFVGVEGDWPDCERVNRYVKSTDRAGGSALDVLEGFDRWPTWMWANREVERFAEWLRAHNAGLPPERRVGFYGLDVYSLWDSMREVVSYLSRIDPAAAASARRSYECFAPYAEDAQEYAVATRLVPATCENEVVAALAEVRRVAADRAHRGSREGDFHAEQNALVAKNAEAYYRAMVQGGAASWNVRDNHMADTLERLMTFYGPHAKAVVWEHNTHVGDARYTDMVVDGEVNVGQILRERHGGGGVVLVGFSTHHGEVIAGDDWGAPMRRMRVPAARERSYEDALHRLGGDRLLLFTDGARHGDLLTPRGHRAIGVVYRPTFERFGNYVPTVLPCRYDALLHVDETTALAPLRPRERGDGDLAETYPWGV